MRNRQRQRENRRKYRAMERSGNSVQTPGGYKDPTAFAAIKHVDEEKANSRQVQQPARSGNAKP